MPPGQATENTAAVNGITGIEVLFASCTLPGRSCTFESGIIKLKLFSPITQHLARTLPSIVNGGIGVRNVVHPARGGSSVCNTVHALWPTVYPARVRTLFDMLPR